MQDLKHLGREIHRRYDDLGVIQVFDDGNKRYLSFGTADEQSCQLLMRPEQPQHGYTRAMIAVLSMLDRPPQQALVLGTGGGMLARALHSYFPQLHCDAVDLRKAVIMVAHQYFGLPRDARLTTHVSPAQDFLQTCPQRHYDLLFSDLYLADGLDTGQLHESFIGLCEQALSENGWLVLNLWKEHREDGLFLPLLRSRFATVMHATTSDGNWIVWACRSSVSPDKQTLRNRSKELGQTMGFNLWQSAKGFLRH